MAATWGQLCCKLVGGQKGPGDCGRGARRRSRCHRRPIGRAPCCCGVGGLPPGSAGVGRGDSRPGVSSPGSCPAGAWERNGEKETPWMGGRCLLVGKVQGRPRGVRAGGAGEAERRERVIRDVTGLVITDSSAWIGRAGGRPGPPRLWRPEPLLEIRAAAAARGSGRPRGREPARRRPGAGKLHARAPRSLLSGNKRIC